MYLYILTIAISSTIYNYKAEKPSVCPSHRQLCDVCLSDLHNMIAMFSGISKFISESLQAL